MSDLLEQIKHTVDATIPDKDELVHEGHKKRDYIMLILRNVFVGVAAVLFILSFFFDTLVPTPQGLSPFIFI